MFEGYSKIWHEVLADDKMGLLSDHLWRRAIEIILAAGIEGRGGWLPDTTRLAWILHTSQAEMEQELAQLAAPGVKIVEKRPDGWFVRNYEKRNESKDPTAAVRQKRFRQRREQRVKELYAATEHAQEAEQPLRNALRDPLRDALITGEEDKEEKKYISRDEQTEGEQDPPLLTAIGQEPDEEKPRRKRTKPDSGERPLTEQQIYFQAVCDCVGWDHKLLSKEQSGQVAQLTGILKRAGYTVDDVHSFHMWWFNRDWRGRQGQYPTLAQLRTEIAKVKQAAEQAEIPTRVY
jgi:hypothetical protein